MRIDYHGRIAIYPPLPGPILGTVIECWPTSQGERQGGRQWWAAFVPEADFRDPANGRWFRAGKVIVCDLEWLTIHPYPLDPPGPGSPPLI